MRKLKKTQYFVTFICVLTAFFFFSEHVVRYLNSFLSISLTNQDVAFVLVIVVVVLFKLTDFEAKNDKSKEDKVNQRGRSHLFLSQALSPNHKAPSSDRGFFYG